MLDAPDKRLFLGIGGLEAASQLLGFVGASKLPGQHGSCLTLLSCQELMLMCTLLCPWRMLSE